MYRRKTEKFVDNPFANSKCMDFGTYTNFLLINLNSSARKVLSIIIKKICEEGLDKRGRIFINYEELSAEQKQKISRSTFYRGIANCIDSNIVAESKNLGFFYINPSCIPTSKIPTVSRKK